MTEQQTVPNVGLRIRALREQRRLSLRALAERCNLSVNAISLIERGENSPTVSSLHLLATALGVSITDFFQDDHELNTVLVRHDRRLTYERHGVAMESLGFGLRNQQLEPFLITVEPDAGNDEPVTHPGQEFVYCLEGEVEYHVAGERYQLKAGDSLLLEAARPHYFCNPTQTPATILVVFQAAESGHLARQRHLEA